MRSVSVEIVAENSLQPSPLALASSARRARAPGPNAPAAFRVKRAPPIGVRPRPPVAAPRAAGAHPRTRARNVNIAIERAVARSTHHLVHSSTRLGKADRKPGARVRAATRFTECPIHAPSRRVLNREYIPHPSRVFYFTATRVRGRLGPVRDVARATGSPPAATPRLHDVAPRGSRERDDARKHGGRCATRPRDRTRGARDSRVTRGGFRARSDARERRDGPRWDRSIEPIGADVSDERRLTTAF